MERPAAKSFLDRVFKPPGAAPSQPKSFLEQFAEVKTDATPAATSQKPQNTQTFNRLIDFKETLKQRMKAKRQQIRMEEEEDDLIDEEYHTVARKDEDEASKDSGETEPSEDKDDAEDEDAESEADEDFKLNLDEDEDEETASSKKSKSDSKKDKSSASSRKDSCYDFDSDESEDLSRLSKDRKSDKKKSLIEIPSTNSIPSNQLTKNQRLNTQNTLTNSEFESLDDDTTHERLYLETIPFDNRRSIDEISFNYESNNNNTTDSTINSLSLPHTSMNQSGELEKNDEEEVDLDALAMLCSGQFKPATNNSRATSSITIEKITVSSQDKSPNTSQSKLALDNDDLYDATADDCEESKSKGTLKESEGAKNNTGDDTDEDAEDSDIELSEEKPKEKVRNRVIDDDEDANDAYDNKEKAEEGDEDEEDEEDNESGEEEEEEIEGSGEPGEEPLKKEDFLEKEAELSGSDAGSDDEEDGEDEVGSLVFSGDEDELPSDSELKEQLGKIYLKDQLDQDKKEIRMFKEMYLADGEMHQDKDFRRKQFLWKNLNDDKGILNHFSSDEDEEDDEDDEENDEAGGDDEKIKDKSKRFAKSLAKRNWRSVRHEREEFVKKKALDGDKLLSDEEENEDSSSSGSNFKVGSAVFTSNMLKKGQQLLKQTVTAKVSQQQKRSLNGEVTTTTTSSTTTTATATLTTASPNRPPTKSSISIEKISAKTTTSSPGSGKANNENLLSKFSFLNRDKGYLTRISSYVNKNFFAEGGSSSSKAFANRNNNNMVFASIDVDASNDSSEPKFSSTVAKKAGSYQTSTGLSSSKTAASSSVLNESVEAVSAPKRTRYEDTCESIFNHIN